MDEPTPVLTPSSAPLKAEWCAACPVPHRFADMSDGGLIYTHSVNEKGDTICRKCSAARPCQGTVVPGKAGFRVASSLREKSVHRGLNYDGPIR
jgi:hypothetical protein